VQISALEGQRVAIWGFGREGQAALDSIRKQLPKLPLTLFCSEAEAVGARARLDDRLDIRTAVDEAELTRFDIVIKSPGISPYAAPAVGAALHGTRFIGGSALWFTEHAAKAARGQVICVTGTKGKSTVSALIAHLLRAAGKRTALAGNIGLPLLSLLDATPEPAYWVIELSSYQTGEALNPDVAVVLNLFPEHLDWHGSEERYYADKLALVTQANPRALVLNAGDARLRAVATAAGACIWFDNAAGWHLHADKVFRGERQVLDLRGLPLPGRHNGLNLCAALAAIEALGLDAVALAAHAASFVPLPHRLQRLGVRDGIEYINDSISTTPHASVAALDCFAGRRMAIIVGGFDRGLDWSVFVERIRAKPPLLVITQGQNGPRIHDRIEPMARAGRLTLLAAEDLTAAVAKAQHVLGNEGLLLLSPGAPSFPRYTDYTERGRHFAKLAGFDSNAIGAIAGLGVA